MTTVTTPVHAEGDTVTYLGHPAAVVIGNEPDDWTPGKPGSTVNIRFDRHVPGMSRQMDVPATAVMPASKAA